MAESICSVKLTIVLKHECGVSGFHPLLSSSTEQRIFTELRCSA